MATSKYSRIFRDQIEFSFWLTFDAEGAVAMTRAEPLLGSGQRAMKCMATLPQSLFEVAALQARIVVADEPSKLELNVSAAGRDMAFDLQQQLTALKVKYKMATGKDA